MYGIFKRNFHFIKEETVEVNGVPFRKILDQWKPKLPMTDPQYAPDWIKDTATYKAAMRENPKPILETVPVVEAEPEDGKGTGEGTGNGGQTQQPKPSGFTQPSFGAFTPGQQTGLQSK